MNLLYSPVCMYDSLTYFHPSSNKHRFLEGYSTCEGSDNVNLCTCDSENFRIILDLLALSASTTKF
jgi:hypothetical protein